MARLCLAALAAFLCGTVLHATTYPPVSFDELVTRADVIFVGTVRDVRPFAVQTRAGVVIKTRVIFDVSESMYGDAGTTQVMEFLGGELNGASMEVAGMPTFFVGNQHVVFARRGPSVNPIVGFTHGLLRVKADASGTQRVLTHDGFALGRPESIGTAAARASSGSRGAMTLPQLRDRIVGALNEARRR